MSGAKIAGLIAIGIGILGGFGVLMASCNRINPGHVGILIHLSGSDRGDVEAVLPGRHFVNPFTTSVVEYPTFVQTAVWTASITEGSPVNEEITFNSKEGLTISADISLSYQLNPEKAAEFYSKFRADRLIDFTRGFFRNVARDGFNTIASTYNVEELYGEKKAQFLQRVREVVNEKISPYGITVEQFGFVGAPRLPKTVLDALDAKITATQRAMQSENELRISQAEAAKEVAVAKGHAEAVVAEAAGAAEANRVLNESLTASLLEWHRIEKWDGVLPTVQSGSGVMMQLPGSTR